MTSNQSDNSNGLSSPWGKLGHPAFEDQVLENIDWWENNGEEEQLDPS